MGGEANGGSGRVPGYWCAHNATGTTRDRCEHSTGALAMPYTGPEGTGGYVLLFLKACERPAPEATVSIRAKVFKTPKRLTERAVARLDPCEGAHRVVGDASAWTASGADIETLVEELHQDGSVELLSAPSVTVILTSPVSAPFYAGERRFNKSAAGPQTCE